MLRLLALLLTCAGLIPASSFAQQWSEYAFISSTLGVSDSRICIGEASRGELGCPSFAPTISPTGRVHATGGLTVNTISLTTTGTTWGYLGSAASYLPNLNTNNISLSTINGISVTNLGDTSPTNVPAFSVHKNGVNQTVTSNVMNLVTWPSKHFDTYNNFNTSTNRFTPTVAGTYIFHASVYCPTANNLCHVEIRKNNGVQASRWLVNSASQSNVVQAVIILSMNGSSDYVDVYANLGGGTEINGTAAATNFSGSLLASGNGLISGTGATTLSGLTDVALASPATGQILTYNGTSWVNSSGASGDRLTSGTLSVTANSSTAIISLTTNGTTWGYLGSNSSYLPTLNTSAISATAVQISSNTAVTCGSGNAGTLRYNNSNTALELCTGTGWQMMGVGIPAGTISAFASTI